MNFRKRLFALIMSVTMVLTYMPALAFADTEGSAGSDSSALEQNVEQEATNDTGEEAGTEAATDENGVAGSEETADISNEIEIVEEEPAGQKEAALSQDKRSDGTTSTRRKTSVPTVEIADNDELLMEYMQSKLTDNNTAKAGKKVLRARSNRRSSLGDNDALIYDSLVEQVRAVASGSASSTHMTVPITEEFQISMPLVFSASDVNLDTLYTLDKDEAPVLTDEALKIVDSKIEYKTGSIVNALCYDMPYELFWYDKTENGGTASYLENISCGEENGEQYISLEGAVIAFDFTVAKAYRRDPSDPEGEYTVDSAKISAANNAAENADGIITSHAGEKPVDMLYSYATDIINMTEYDDVSSADDTVPYGDPWQMIYVFDKDDSTNVVCEGYSKAFQYLVNNTSALGDAGIECYSVTGTLRGEDATGAGNHMWNILHMDDGNYYLADLTNSDSEGGVESSGLFLNGAYEFASDADEFSYDTNKDETPDTFYTYDEDTRSVFVDELIMSTADYASNEGGDEYEYTEVAMAVNDKQTISVSKYNPAAITFECGETGGYQLNFSSKAEHIRVTVFESTDAQDEDADKWTSIEMQDYQSDTVYDENDEPIGDFIDAEFPFYAVSGKTYRFELETAFNEEAVDVNVELTASDKAGLENGFRYTVFSSGSDEESKHDAIRIVKYTGGDKSRLVIPGNIGGKPVEVIGCDAITGNFDSIVISEGILELGIDAFLGIDNLKSVTLPSSLKTIYGAPFINCPALTDISFSNKSEFFKVDEDNSVLLSADGRTLYKAFGGHKDAFTVPDGVRKVEGWALCDLTPKSITFPASVAQVERTPETLTEMHFANANCDVDDYGIPVAGGEDDEAIYPTVYAPAGGSLEAYCNENNIPFKAEGEYDPDAPVPMGDPIAFNKGDTSEQTAVGSFNSVYGTYQDFTFTASGTDVYGLNVYTHDITGDVNEAEAFTMVLKDGSGKEVAPLLTEPAISSQTGELIYPSSFYYLTKGQNYTLTVTATEAAIQEEYESEMELYLFDADEISVNGGWDLLLNNWESSGKADLASFVAPLDGTYTVNIKRNAPDDDTDLQVFLFAMKADGSPDMIASGKTEAFTANLTKGKTYYLAGTLTSSGQATALVQVQNDEYIPDDPGELEIAFENDHYDVFSDGSTRINYNISGLSEASDKNYGIKYRLGVKQEDNWAADPMVYENGDKIQFFSDYGINDDGSAFIDLDGEQLKKLQFDVVPEGMMPYLEVEIYNQEDNETVSSGGCWFTLQEAVFDVDFPAIDDPNTGERTEYLLKGESITINAENEAFICNSSFPEGRSGIIKVTDVIKIQEDNGSGNITCTPVEDENGEILSWEINTPGYGFAYFELTYLDFDGKECTYEFNVSSGTDRYEITIDSADGRDTALPGETINLYATAKHTYYEFERDEEGNVVSEKLVEEKMHPTWYVNGIFYRNFNSDVATFGQNDENNSYAWLTFSKDADLDQLSTKDKAFEIEARVNDNDADQAIVKKTIYLTDSYVKIEHADIDKNLKVGGTTDVDLKAMEHRIGSEPAEVAADTRYIWNFNSGDVKITDGNGADVVAGEPAEGSSFTIERITDQYCQFGVEAQSLDENGEYTTLANQNYFFDEAKTYSVELDYPENEELTIEASETKQFRFKTAGFESLEGYEISCKLLSNDGNTLVDSDKLSYTTDGTDIILTVKAEDIPGVDNVSSFLPSLTISREGEKVCSTDWRRVLILTWSDTPVYEWADDYSTVTGIRRCSYEKYNQTETVNTTPSVITEPTCESTGVTKYTSDGFENPIFSVQTKTADTPATGHNWSEPVYTWSEDNKQVTATRTCSNPNHECADAGEATETVSVEETVTTPAACETPGQKKYTSAAFKNTAFKAQEKTETINALGHDPEKHAAVEAKCETAGNIEYYECARCHNLYLDEECTNPTNAEAVVTEPLEHEYGDPVYDPAPEDFDPESGTETVTATRKCQREGCGHPDTATATITKSAEEAASCTEPGTVTYTATFDKAGFGTWTTTRDVESIGHLWGAVEYTWSEDNSKVTAKRVCTREGCGEVQTETVDATSEVTTEPTCTKDGVRLFTSAEFSNEAFTVQTNEVTEPATGHNWEEPEYSWNDDNTAVTATRHCSNENHEEGDETETVGVTAAVTVEATCTANGLTTHTSNEFENNAFEVQRKTTEDPDALGHSWDAGTITERATKEAPGKITYKCERCGEENPVKGDIPQLENDYVAPNAAAEGDVSTAETAAAELENLQEDATDEEVQSAETAAMDAAAQAEASANTAVETATTSLTEKTGALETAQQILADAERALSEATEEEKAAAQTAVTAAQKAVDDAQSAVNAAQQEVKDAEATSSKAKAVTARVAAKTSSKKASAALKAANAAASTVGNSAVAAAQAAVNAAADAKKDAEAAEQRAQEALDAVKSAGYSEDSDEYQNAQNELNAAKDANTAATTACTTAANALSTATIAKQAAEAAERARAAEAARIAEAMARDGIYDGSLPKVKAKKPAAKKGNLTAKWKKLTKKQLKKSKATNYEIWVCQNPGFARGETIERIVSKGKASLKVKGLQRKTKYYVRVRAIKYVGGVKYVGPWKQKSIKTK